MSIIKLRMVLPNKVKEFNRKLRAKELHFYDSNDLTEFTTIKPSEPSYITDKTINYGERSKERTDESTRKKELFRKGHMKFENEIDKKYVQEYTSKYNLNKRELITSFDFETQGKTLDEISPNFETLTNFNTVDNKNSSSL